MADPNNTNVYWSGGILGGMQVSKATNAGSTWIRYSLNASGYTYALAVDPYNSNIVYAGGNPGVYKTTNSGSSWTYCSTGLSGYVYDIAIDPVTTSTLYAATPNGLFRSMNSGLNWTNTGCTNVNTVVVDPDDPTTIYAGTLSGVYKSTSGGGSWTVMNDGLEDIYITSLGINPGVYLYCGTSDAGMFRWELNVGITEGAPQQCVFDLMVTPNPVHDHAILHFSIASAANVYCALYDITGRKMRTLADGYRPAGYYELRWDRKDDNGDDVPDGIYVCRCQSGDRCAVRQLVVLD